MQTAPDCYVQMHNMAKPKNLGMILRSCAAFGVTGIFILHPFREKPLRFGHITKSLKLNFGDKGTLKQLRYKIFNSITEFKTYCEQRRILVCGISRVKSTPSVAKFDGKGQSTCFVVNSFRGELQDELFKACDTFVRVPNYSANSKGLDVVLETSIVLQRFGEYRGLTRAETFGEKFKDCGWYHGSNS